MIEVNAVFTKQSVREMSRGKRISSYIIFPILAVIMLAGGLAVFIQKPEQGDVVMGIIMMVLAPVIFVLGLVMTNSETKNNIKSFGVDKDDVIMNYKFSEKGVLISRTTQGKTDKETLYYRELYKVKRTKKCFMLYLSKDELFYVPTDSFVSGTPDDLFKLFYDSKIILDY